MSHAYRAITWTPFKKRYDRLLALTIVAYLVTFVGVTLARYPGATPQIAVIRATGTAGLLLLHVILAIGPLARLSPRWLPLLYNRRHMGVSMFLLAAVHGALATFLYHSGWSIDPLLSVFVTDAGWTVATFPFQAFGFGALLILFVMAATSHDFWLANLTAPVWKSLHMGVYVAYGLLLVHVAFGVLQSELHPGYVAVLLVGFFTIGGLHLVAGFRERAADRPAEPAAPADHAPDGFVRACAVEDIPDNRARIVTLSGERVAIFRYDGKVAAVSNVCQHQNGPLGEGRVVNGCITCPWHGYQYRPEDGQSPPPFTEKVPTFEVRVDRGEVWIDPVPRPAGTRVEPAVIDDRGQNR